MTLADLHHLDNTHPTRVKNYLKYFNELNIDGFDFTNGYKCSDMHKFEKLKNLSNSVFQITFYQVGDKWKHNFIPIEISKNESDRLVDLIKYKNHFF